MKGIDPQSKLIDRDARDDLVVGGRPTRAPIEPIIESLQPMQ